MARVSPGYTAFVKGEISPLMYGRVDLEQYGACLAKCRNCVIRPFGLVSRMAGTEYVAGTKNNGKVKLLKFSAAADDSYIIECGVGYFRFFRNGAAVLDGNDNVYEIANDFTSSMIDSLQYVQLDDVIKIVTRDDNGNTNKPKELIRYGAADWVFKDVEFVCTPFLSDNGSDVSITVSAVNGTITMTAGDTVFKPGHINSFWKIGRTTTIDNVQKQGFVKITEYISDTQVRAKVLWTLTIDDMETMSTQIWAEGAWSDYRGYPSVIGLLDGRLYYGGTPFQPRNIYGSQPYAYEDFTPAVNNESSGAINIEPASNASGDSSRLQWLTGTAYLVAGTAGAEFVIKASGDASVTPTDVNVKARTNWGSENIQPVVLGSMIHFIQAKGGKVRNFYYDYYTDMYKAADVSLYSEHLLESGIIDVANQKNPDNVLWCLRKDGKVAGMVYEPEQEVQAWFLAEDEDGAVESIESVPSASEMYDEVYLVVKRVINGQTVRHIERMQNPVTADKQVECWYVRDGLNYNAYSATTGNNLTLSATSGIVTVTADLNVFTLDMTGRKIRFVGENYEIIGQGVITSYVSEKTVTVNVEKDFSDTVLTGGRWGISVVRVGGLNHLTGRNVQVFADGAVQAAKTVDNNGRILLDTDAFYVTAGLPYTSYMTTMPLEVGSQNGSSVGKNKRVNELALRVWRTSAIRVGRDLSNMQTVKYRNPQTPMGTAEALHTGIIGNIKYNQGWTDEANVTLEQSLPLPMNILAIVPIVNEVDK